MHPSVSSVLSLLSELKIRNVVCKPSKLLSSCGELIWRSCVPKFPTAVLTAATISNFRTVSTKPVTTMSVLELDLLSSPPSFQFPCRFCLLLKVNAPEYSLPWTCVLENLSLATPVVLLCQKLTSLGIRGSLLEPPSYFCLYRWAGNPNKSNRMWGLNTQILSWRRPVFVSGFPARLILLWSWKLLTSVAGSHGSAPLSASLSHRAPLGKCGLGGESRLPLQTPVMLSFNYGLQCTSGTPVGLPN